MFEGDVEHALKLLRTGADHPADRRDRFVLAIFHFFSGVVGHYLPENEVTEGVARINASGHPTAMAMALAGQAAVVAERDLSAAIDLYQRATAMLAACGDRLIEQSSRAQLLSVLARSEDSDRALESFVDIVNDWQICGDTLLASGIGHLVVLLVRLGYQDGAARLYGAVTRGIELDALVPGLDGARSAMLESMGDAAFTTSRDAGAALSYQEVGELARGLIQSARDELRRSV